MRIDWFVAISNAILHGLQEGESVEDALSLPSVEDVEVAESWRVPWSINRTLKCLMTYISPITWSEATFGSRKKRHLLKRYITTRYLPRMQSFYFIKSPCIELDVRMLPSLWNLRKSEGYAWRSPVLTVWPWTEERSLLLIGEPGLSYVQT